MSFCRISKHLQVAWHVFQHRLAGGLPQKHMSEEKGRTRRALQTAQLKSNRRKKTCPFVEKNNRDTTLFILTLKTKSFLAENKPFLLILLRQEDRKLCLWGWCKVQFSVLLQSFLVCCSIPAVSDWYNFFKHLGESGQMFFNEVQPDVGVWMTWVLFWRLLPLWVASGAAVTDASLPVFTESRDIQPTHAQQ